MIEASVDLAPLLDKLADTAAALGGRALAAPIEADVAAHYSAQPVPVDTGRLRRALTQTPRAPERRVVVLSGTALQVQIRVPYARYQLPRLAPYNPQGLGARLASHIAQRLSGQRVTDAAAP